MSQQTSLRVIIDWYKKLDLIEATIKYLYAFEKNPMYHPIVDEFSRQLNFEFERHKFAYRVIEKEIVEITSKNEIVSIETALATSSKLPPKLAPKQEKQDFGEEVKREEYPK